MHQLLSPFSGTGVALVTPFTSIGAVDFDALGRIIDYVIEGGVDYIVSLGTTGEAVTLNAAECRQVLDFTLERTENKRPVVVGHFGDNNTAALVQRVKNFDCTGLAGIMSSSPAYNKPTQEGIYQHFLALAEATTLPIIIYNVPGRTSSNVLPETTLRLAETSSQFAAVKEASGRLEQVTEIIRHCPDHFALLSGDDPTALPSIAAGAQGSISVIANAYPWQWSRMVRAALDHDFTLAQELNFQLWDLHHWLYLEGNPTGVKAAMAELDLCLPNLRLPLVELSEESKKELLRRMQQVPEVRQLR
ncbi:MAG: 4-hydroxy-tetrahydrodipicolinate synthase [Bacteroidota bacterium]